MTPMVGIAEESVEYLQSLPAIRERCHLVLNSKNLQCFTLHLDELPKVAKHILDLIERDYGRVDSAEEVAKTLGKIPPHGRWRHFGEDGMNSLLERLSDLSCDQKTESVLDLFVVAVLLDAGAGDLWKFQDPISGNVFTRSEGLAMASLRMFEAGKFSSTSQKMMVDIQGLMAVDEDLLKSGFQVTKDNPLLGLSGRVSLLHRLGRAIETHQKYFPNGRPGSLLYFLKDQVMGNVVDIEVLWKLVIDGFGSVWPEGRTKIKNTSLGDAWPCMALEGAIVPFHKLSQWLTYSLLEPLERLGGLHFSNTQKLTALAEYRNGGLLVDIGVIKLKEKSIQIGLANAQEMNSSVPIFMAESQEIIEWRALTVAIIDKLAELLRKQLCCSLVELPLAKILEAGTWKAGREMAKTLRPTTASPPIAIISDGTLF